MAGKLKKKSQKVNKSTMMLCGSGGEAYFLSVPKPDQTPSVKTFVAQLRSAGVIVDCGCTFYV